MSKYLQGKRSEMVKASDPNKEGSTFRTAYYTELSFLIRVNEKDVPKKIVLPFKVDTGARYTIVGLSHPKLERFADVIRNQFPSEQIKTSDASGTDLEIKGYVVEDFYLTEDIVLPKIKIYFSDKFYQLTDHDTTFLRLCDCFL